MGRFVHILSSRKLVGKLILCSGKRANVPYYFPLTDTNIYSIEELCYYIYNNIYIMNLDSFPVSLADFMERELGLVERADTLRKLILAKAILKDIIVFILCSSDFYTENEIIKLIKVIDEISYLKQVKRNKLLADNYLRYHNYAQARKIYEDILASNEAAEFTEKEYGDILHNLSIITLHLDGFVEAYYGFKQAYQYNHNFETLHQGLIALKLAKEDELLKKELEELDNGKALEELITQEFEMADKNVTATNEYKIIKAMNQLREEGKVSLYYREVHELMNKWKKVYRQHHAIQEG